MKQEMTRRMLIIFYGIMAGHMLVACAIVFILKPVQEEGADMKTLTNILAAASVAVTMLAFWMYQQQVSKIAQSEKDDIDKLNAWQSPVILRLAMIEGVCLANLAALYVTGYSLFLYFYVATALAMMYAKPKTLSIDSELQLHDDQ